MSTSNNSWSDCAGDIDLQILEKSSTAANSVCIFCYKIASSHYNNRLFFKNLEKFVGQQLGGKLNFENKSSLVGCCENCGVILSSFSEVYHQLRMLELQLEWKLESLVNIMKLANRVPSRMQQFRCLLEEDYDNNGGGMVQEKLKIVKMIRNDLMRKCTGRLYISQPRVLVERMKESPAPYLLNSSSELVATSSLSLEQSSDVSKVGHFLGWILSFAAVAMLVSSAVPEKHLYKTTTLQIDEEFELTSVEVPENGSEKHHKRNESSMKKNEIMSSKNESEQMTTLLTQPVIAKTECLYLFDNDDDWSDGDNGADDFPQQFEEEQLDLTPLLKFPPPENTEDLNFTSTQQQAERYSLRGNRKRSYKQIETNDDQIQEDEDGTYKMYEKKDHDDTNTWSPTDSDNELQETCATTTKKKIKIIDRQIKCNKTAITVKNDLKTEESAPPREELQQTSLLKGKLITRKKKKSQKRLYCSQTNCREKFATSQDLEGHKKLHGEFNCKFCDISKDYAPSLAVHESKKHAIRPEEDDEMNKRNKNDPRFLPCSRCPSNFWVKAHFLKHFLGTHLDLQGPVGHCCPICKATSMASEPDFQEDHFRKYHNVEGLDPSEIHRCYECSAYFITRSQLIKHLLVFHYEKSCPKCRKNFEELQTLRKHLYCVHPIEAFHNFIFKCDLGNCNETFIKREDFENHKLYVRHETDQEEMECPKCGKRYKGEQKLKIHINRTHVDPSFICQECGKGFRIKHVYEQHLEYHKGPEQWKFECSECGKKCMNKYKLADHVRVHTQEKPYQCQFCGEKYGHRHNWRLHMKSKHKEEYDKMEDAFTTKEKNDGWAMMSRKGSKKGDCLLSGAKVKAKKFKK